MKKQLLSFLVFFVFSVLLCRAQAPTFWGTTSMGGSHNGGSLFQSNATGSVFRTVISCDSPGYPEGTLIQATNGLLYGMTDGGGVYDYGTIFSYNITTGVQTDIYDFAGGDDGQYPVGSLIQVSDSLLYGMTVYGGIYNLNNNGADGVIFKFNIITGKETVMHSFGNGTDGAFPQGSLLKASNGLLYGVTTWGGLYGGSYGDGVIFSYSTSTGAENVLYNFGSYDTDGYEPTSSFIQATNGLLYGTTTLGGNTWGGGTIFSFNTSSNTEAIVYRFASYNYDGAIPYGSLVQAKNGLLYGTTYTGGTEDSGTIYSCTTGGSEIKLYDFLGYADADGAIPYGAFIQASDGQLYGTTSSGGEYFKGTVFNYNISNGTETVIHNFSGQDGDGAHSYGALLEADIVTTTPTSSSICKGTGATLVAGGATTYTWAPATGLSATTGSSVTATPTVTTVYTVSGTGSYGVTTTATDTVNVTPGTALTIIPPSPSICFGSTVALTVSGSTTYTWSPSTDLSVTSGSSVTASPTATTTYTVTGANSNGCAATDSVTVTVNPTPTITATPSPASYCSGGNSTLTASGGNTYTWSPATDLSATIGSSVIASPTITTTYTVTGTNSNNCSATNTVTITVNPAPAITAIASPASYCYGGSSTLIVSGGSTYTWSPSTGLSATTGSAINANPAVTTTYVVTGTNGGDCSAVTTVVVTVGSGLTLTAATPTPLCDGSSTTLTASGAINYTWTPSAGLSATTGATVTADPTATTTYTIDGSDGQGCTGTTTVPVTVNPLPAIPTITQTGDTLFSSAPSGNQWYINDTIIAGATHQTLIINEDGEYLVTVTDLVTGCSSEPDSITGIVEGINRVTFQNYIKIFPNPFNNSVTLTISLSVTDLENWNLQVTDVLGRTVYTTQSLTYTNEIDLSNQPSGMYFITVMNKTDRAVMPVVKE